MPVLLILFGLWFFWPAFDAHVVSLVVCTRDAVNHAFVQAYERHPAPSMPVGRACWRQRQDAILANFPH